MVPDEQPLPQLQNNKGADCGLREEPGSARPHPHQRGHRGDNQNVKYFGVHISEQLNWSNHTDTVVKKAQQGLFNLMTIIESFLSGCITEGGMLSRTDNWVHIACTPGHLQHQVLQEGQENQQGPQPPKPRPVLSASITQTQAV